MKNYRKDSYYLKIINIFLHQIHYMIKLFKIFIVFILIFTIQNKSFAQKSNKFILKTVVIDAGHGGSDPGAHFGKLLEKDIALDVALKLGKKIKRSHPEVKIVYTRTKDVLIPLAERGKIANEAKGDLFISIHVNSVSSSKATGTETYTLGLHKSKANLDIAKKENSVIILEEDYKTKYQGFDPSNAESYIMIGLGQYSYGILSISFASMLEKNYKSKSGFLSRGIKQAGFLVLWRTSMPSILTEIGFISNTNDRRKMSTPQGRDKIAQSMATAFSEYKKSVEVESHYTSSDNLNVKDMTNSLNKNDFKLQKHDYRRESYAIQLISTKKKIPINHGTFGKNYNQIIEIRDNKVYKYLLGVVYSYKDALSLRKVLRKSKYEDCFIVRIKNNKIIKK